MFELMIFLFSRLVGYVGFLKSYHLKRKLDVQLVISSELCIIFFGIILFFSVLLRCVDVEFLWDILAHLAHPKNRY